MSENTVATLYRLPENDEYPILASKGFYQVKTCGPGTKGFITVLALSYIESIILRKQMNMSNILFIESL